MIKNWSHLQGQDLRFQRLTSPLEVNASNILGCNFDALHALAWLLLWSTWRLQWLLSQNLILKVLPMTLNSMQE